MLVLVVVPDIFPYKEALEVSVLRAVAAQLNQYDDRDCWSYNLQRKNVSPILNAKVKKEKENGKREEKNERWSDRKPSVKSGWR
jgi:hypothetical protein